MESSSSELESLLGPSGYVGHGSSINNPGGVLFPVGSSRDNTPTASVTYSSIQLEPRKLYTRRWYCLLLYCILAFGLGICSTAISPISHATQKAFYWNNADIAMVNSLPTLIFVLTVVPCTVLLNTKGLRVACLFGAFCMALGSGIRCISSQPPLCNWTINIGQLVIGLTSSAVYAAPTTFSNVWFPVNQRTSATSISAIGSGLGIGVGSLLGPLLVRVRHKPLHNISISSNAETYLPTSVATAVPIHVLEMRESIMKLLYFHCALSVAVLIAMLLYFPAKPPTPPSTSAAYDRVSVRKGMMALFRRRQFWLIAAIFALTNGMMSGFGSVLDLNLEAAQVPADQITSGWMVMGSLIATVLACIVMSSIADRFRQYIKRLLIAWFVVATAVFVWFALIIQGTLPGNYASLFTSFIVGSLLFLGCTPLFMELACDSAYPVSEGLATGVLNIVSSGISLLFLYVLMVPDIGTQWMNWTVVGSAALCVPLIIPFTPSTGRLAVDTKRPLDDSDETNISRSYGTTVSGAVLS